MRNHETVGRRRGVTRWMLAALVAAGGLAAGCGNGDMDGDSDGDTARLRVVHLSADAPPVDLFVGDSPEAVVEDLAFPRGTGYLELPEGTYDLDVAPADAGRGDAVLELEGLRLDAGRAYTAVAYGPVADIAALALEDRPDDVAADSIRVRAVHAAPDVGPVDIWNVTDPGAPSSLWTGLTYGQAGDSLELPAAAYAVGIDASGDGEADLVFDLPALPAGTAANVYAARDDAGTVFLLAQLSDGSTARIDARTDRDPPGPDEAAVRALHLSPDAPAVDVFVDGADEAAFADVPFGRGTGYTQLDPGPHRFDVAPAGSGRSESVLGVDSIELDAATSYTIVAYDRVAAPIKALALTDRLDAIAAGDMRIRGVHTAEGVGPVDVWALRAGATVPTLVSEELGFGEAGDALDVPAGAYAVALDLDGDAVPELTFELPPLVAGSAVNLFAVADDAGTVSLVAQLRDGNTLRLEPADVDWPIPDVSVRVVHLSRDAPDVDVYANGDRIVSGLAYAETTNALEVPAGTYDLAVTAAGSPLGEAVLDVSDVRLAPERTYTIAAYGDLAEPPSGRPLQALLLEDDASGLDRDRDVRLNVIHVATTVIRGDVFAVEPDGNTPLARDLGFGELATLPDLPSSSYTVGFDAGANGVIDVDFDLPVFAPGSFVNLFVATDADGAVFLLAQTEGAGAIRIPAN